MGAANAKVSHMSQRLFILHKRPASYECTDPSNLSSLSSRMLRPTLSNTCADGCQKGADVGCVDGVNSSSMEQCIESVSVKCSNDICKHYRTALPRPQVFQACQSGCNDAAKDFCNRGQKIFAAEMAKLL